MAVSAQDTANLPLNCQMSQENSAAQAVRREGFRRKKGLSEESWSVGKGFSEVGLKRALKDGHTREGGALHRGM